MLAPRQEDQLYYQSPYQHQRRYPIQQSRDQNYANQIHIQSEPYNERCVDDRIPTMEQRSAQQIEREKLKSFEARRAASHPQLAYEDEIKKDVMDSRPQPQIAQNHGRRGSIGTIVEAPNIQKDKEEVSGKESDDGGFLKRGDSKERILNEVESSINKVKEEQSDVKEESKMSSALTGTPRKRLEGEIGKIEGVYNVGQRSKNLQDEIKKKHNTESGASSDYDKAGQSSSNADSGRGSAAYSSGRRPDTVDTSNESSEPHTLSNYRDQSGHDSEWVDVVETELRHILEPKLHELSLHGNGIANSTLSESISSMTPPLPPLSPGEQSSPNETPKNSRYKHSR